jgi:alpha-glucosidase
MQSERKRMDTDWWKRAVIYQVYPRSFQDTNADGIGDLQGIIDRLDYLNDGTERSLGVDAVWLSPTFPSPMKDFGYDVSDYCGVHPDFGDLATMDRLIEACHQRGMRLLLDFVPNHSSDQHVWFQESRSSRDNPKRDWYIWRDPKPDGSAPNNWVAVFGGPAWEYDEDTGQYYLHSFLKEQPDLNWRNPDVVAAMHDVMRFWLRRGIDGFRIDVIGMILKHPELADNPLNPDYDPVLPEERRLLQVNTVNYPDVFNAVAGIRSVLDEFPGAMVVGEVFGPADVIARYHGGDLLNGLHLAFNFQLIVNESVETPWDATVIRKIVSDLEAELPRGAQPCYALNNHDRSRFVSRNNADGLGHVRARAACLLLLGLRSTPFLYYGEEIGMVDVEIPEEKQRDPARFRHFGRDPQRTPMQWDDSPGRGFTKAEPWLPFGPDEINVQAQQADPDSMLSLYRDALWLRKQEQALHSGSHRTIESVAGSFVFERLADDARPVLCALSTATETLVIEVPEGYSRILIASDRAMDGSRVESSIELPPLGAVWVV